MTKATTLQVLQRAGGWCESVQERVFPLFESAVKTARFVSFNVRFERSLYGGNVGGNAEEIAFRPSVMSGNWQDSTQGREAFCVSTIIARRADAAERGES